MKKFLVLLLMAAAVSENCNAQEGPVHKLTLGGRLSGGAYYGPELSMHLGMTDRHRFEFDLGGRFHPSGNWYRFVATACFHWDFNIMSGWNWFVGPGVQGGVYIDPDNSNNTYFPIGVGGQIGMEFDFSVPFDVPLVVGLDTRPMVDLFYPLNDFYFDGHVALSLRYILK